MSYEKVWNPHNPFLTYGSFSKRSNEARTLNRNQLEENRYRWRNKLSPLINQVTIKVIIFYQGRSGNILFTDSNLYSIMFIFSFQLSKWPIAHEDLSIWGSTKIVEEKLSTDFACSSTLCLYTGECSSLQECPNCLKLRWSITGKACCHNRGQKEPWRLMNIQYWPCIRQWR